MVGTCVDMCPRFERYRRERENNLFNLKLHVSALCFLAAEKLTGYISTKIPGTKRVDHKRAVKMYERASGDKTLPLDLRPPPVLRVRSRI